LFGKYFERGALHQKFRRFIRKWQINKSRCDLPLLFMPSMPSSEIVSCLGFRYAA